MRACPWRSRCKCIAYPDAEPQKETPPGRSGGAPLLWDGTSRSDPRYAAVVAKVIVDQLPRPLLSAARYTARRR